MITKCSFLGNTYIDVVQASQRQQKHALSAEEGGRRYQTAVLARGHCTCDCHFMPLRAHASRDHLGLAPGVLLGPQSSFSSFPVPLSARTAPQFGSSKGYFI